MGAESLGGGVALAAILSLIQACTSENVTGVDIGAISVSPSSSAVMEGYAVQFEALVRDEAGEPLGPAPAVWSSDDEDVATVSSDGVATGVAPGEATIRASFEGAEGTAILTVEPGPDIDISDKSVTLHAGAGSESPDPVELDVTNKGGGDLGPLSMDVAYGDGEAGGWLDAELAGTEVPTSLTLEATSDELPAGIYEATVTLSTPDPDGIPAPVTVTLSLSAFTVSEDQVQLSEAGGSDSVTVVLETPPASDVVIRVESEDEDEVEVGPASLTFTPSDWDEPQTVVLTGASDSEADGDQTTNVQFTVDDDASDVAYLPALSRTVGVTTVDGDAAGFSVDETGDGTTVGEVGDDDTFTVVLRTRPEADVVITASSSDTGEATVSPGTLTFRPADWDVPKTVTVSGVDDDLVDGSQESTVRLQVDDDRSAAAYHDIDDQTVTVTTADDDGASLTINETDGGTEVTETGDTDAFTVVLTAQPTGNVVLDVTSADAGEARVAPATLTFTPGDWSTAQPVTVTGVDDDAADGDVQTTVTVAVRDGESAPEYGGVADGTVDVVTLDDEGASLVVTESGDGTTVSESGTTDGFTVALGAQPAGSVVIDVTSGDPEEATVSPTALTFTSANWSTAQAVTVTGIDDAAIDGSQETEVTLAVRAAESDDAFDDVAARTVTVTTTDDDALGFTITSGDAVSVDEGGTGEITMVLDAEPAADVSITATSADPLVATLDPASVTFTPATWDDPRTVTVTGVDNEATDGERSTSVVLSVTGADIPDQTVTVTVADDDVAGFTLNDASGPTVAEGGTVTFTAVLTAEPAGSVTLGVTSGDTGEVTVAPATLTFEPGAWNDPQEVTLTGVPDGVADGDQQTTVTVAVDAGSSDAAFGGLPPEEVTVTTTDVDGAGLTVADADRLGASEGGGSDPTTVVLDATPRIAHGREVLKR